MSVVAHLMELRRRLIWALVGIGIATIPGWIFVDKILSFMQRPLVHMNEAGLHTAQLNFQTIGGAFDLRMRVALAAALLLSSPWWLAQIGMYIWPGLKRKERLHVAAFGIVGVVLFLGGAYAGITMVPQAIQILMTFVPTDAAVLLRADSYLNFYMALVFAFGFSFLLPEFLVALNFAGVLSARVMLKGWRWAVVLSFALAAFINPIPNPIPMTIQALGLIALYFLAVGISAWKDTLRRRAQEASEQTGNSASL